MPRLYSLRGRPNLDAELQPWRDVSDEASAVFLTLGAASYAAYKMSEMGWSDIRIVSEEITSACDYRRETILPIRVEAKPEDHPLANGVQPQDATLQRLEEYRKQIASQKLDDEACYLSPTEQLRAARLLDW